MPRPRILRPLIAALAVALVLAGCSDDAAEVSTAGGAVTTAPAVETTLPDAAVTTVPLPLPATTATTAPPPPRTPAPTPAPTAAPRPTTATTAAVRAGDARVTLVNGYPKAVEVTLNGQELTLSPGQRRGPVGVLPADSGNDVVEVVVVDDRTCGTGDASDHFDPDRSYRLHVSAGEASGCGQGSPVVRFTVTAE